MAAPGLERHRLALLAAREDVGNPRAGTNWAVFAYEKHHDLRLLDSGAGGPDELGGKFSPTSIMYGLCRIPDPSTGLPRVVLIHWVGEKVPESQRLQCAGHMPVIREFFREASVVLSAHRPEEVTQEGLSRALTQLAPTAAPPARKGTPPDAQELVGTNYRKTNPALEIRRTQRDSFWAQAEREEEQRKEQERQRELERARRWERERREEERRGAAERERRLQEKERMIEEQRKEQARLEAEERRKEKERWEQQQREHEEAMRERGRHSQSIEKAAEAAVLVSQRSQNPRDFFRQRERSGSTSGPPPPTTPLGTRPGARRPFLRYQRSLTESAFIFRRPDPPPSPGPPQPGTFRAEPPPSPRKPQPPLPASPIGRGTPSGAPISPMEKQISPSAPLGTLPSPTGTGTPPSPTGTGPPHATSPIGTAPLAPCTTLGPLSLGGAGAGPPSTIPGPGPLPSPSSPPSGSPGSLCGVEHLPPCSTPGLGPPHSPPMQSPPGTEEPKPLPRPNLPRDEDRPPLDSFPSPPSWGSPELPVEPGEGVPSPRGGSPMPGLVPVPTPGAGTPPCSPSPPREQDTPQANSGHNGIGGHGQGSWPDPWEQDPSLRQGDESSDNIVLPQPLHKGSPGFALLLPKGRPPPAEDQDHSPHAV
ncbi:drebrin-like [Calypte anna]|uniref:drebrin-like n=1 Tax=Calypte anna TaxID=9244 RepID=UPI0011C3D257|nr:drebrin-like [Calypte anna]